MSSQNPCAAHVLSCLACEKTQQLSPSKLATFHVTITGSESELQIHRGFGEVHVASTRDAIIKTRQFKSHWEVLDAVIVLDVVILLSHSIARQP